jgi:hypothetical protein
MCLLLPLSGLIALMMEAVSTSETSVSFYQTTRRNIAEDSHLHTHRRENLKFEQGILLRSITLSLKVTGVLIMLVNTFKSAIY